MEKFDESKILTRQLQIDLWNQDLLSKQVCLCLGAGGLGSGVIISLLRLGVKHLIIIDYDKVELHNLTRQILFSKDDIGKRKVDASVENAKIHNIVDSQIESYDFDILTNWPKVVELARKSNVIFNMIDVGKSISNSGDYFDLAVQSLCLSLNIPLIQGGTFNFTITVDYFNGGGFPCLRCTNDELKKEIISKLLPKEIQDLNDLTWIPRNNNPIALSNYFLCQTCSNFMTTIFVNNLFGVEESIGKNRIIFYTSSFESVSFNCEVNRKCELCSESNSEKIKELEKQDELKKKEELIKQEEEDKLEEKKNEEEFILQEKLKVEEDLKAEIIAISKLN